jgi:acyl carrier protein
MALEAREKIRAFILRNFLEGEAEDVLQDDVSLERSHIVDSAGVLDLILFIEETFDVVVENEEATPENFDTVDAVVAFVQRKAG